MLACCLIVGLRLCVVGCVRMLMWCCFVGVSYGCSFVLACFEIAIVAVPGYIV